VAELDWTLLIDWDLCVTRLMLKLLTRTSFSTTIMVLGKRLSSQIPRHI
jgi:hypothetical protein